ncbi:MAG: hypothetical protein EBW76_08170, partial [Actinobacteria bacterium]|nr:hypothetical protein [Actinomycetota bacterium]
SDSITNQAILDASWALVAAVDGYNVTFSEFTNVSDVELYYETEVWESSTSGGTYTLHSTHVKQYGGGGGVTQTKTTAGWYYAIVYTYNGNSVNGGQVRIPSSGGFQLT